MFDKIGLFGHQLRKLFNTAMTILESFTSSTNMFIFQSDKILNKIFKTFSTLGFSAHTSTHPNDSSKYFCDRQNRIGFFSVYRCHMKCD